MRTATTQTRVVARDTAEAHGSARRFVRTLDPARYDWTRIRSLMSNATNLKGVSLNSENELRDALGLEPLPRVKEVQVCPIHGVVHDTACDGEQGEARWVHPKEKLVKAPGFGRTRKERKSIEVTPDVYHLLLKFKGTGDWDWSKSLTEMFYLATEGAGYDNEKFPEAGIQ